MRKIFTRVASLICSLILIGVTTVSAQTKLISFWDFNQTIPSSGGGGDSLGTVTSYINGATSVTAPLYANYTANAPSTNEPISARIVFKGHPASGNQSIMDNNNGGSFIYDYSSNHTYFGNSRKYYNSSDSTGSGGNIFVRYRNPVQNDTGYIYIPTTGYQNIVLNFAMQQSTTSSGPRENIFQYSTNGYAGPWNKLTSAMDTFKLAGVHKADTLYCGYMNTTWYPVRINFSSDPSVNNISGFVIRWEYAGGTITGTSGNDRYDNFAVTADSVCPTFTTQPVSSTVCGGGASNASFTIGTEGGTSVSYQWYVNTGSGFNSIGNGAPYSNATTNTLSITGATSSMNGYVYECQVTNPGCGTITSNSATLTVDPVLVISVPTFSNVTCTSNGSAIASISGGTSPYTYSWSNSQTNITATNLIAGTYTITVKDKIGCSATSTVVISQNGLAVNITSSANIECTAFGSAAALASNGTSPYTYSWSDGETNATASALGAGTYTITAKDNTGCTGSTSVTILQIPPMRDSISGQYKVIHYWDFNSTPPAGGAGGDSLGTSTFPLTAPYSLIPGQNPRIVYSHPVGGGILDNSAPSANQEAWYNDLPLLGNDTGGVATSNLYIRSRNPEINSFIYMYLPTTGFGNIKLDYAISVSSTKGANYNLLSYSTNGGASWNNLTTTMDTFKRHSNGPDSLFMLTATPGEQAGTAWTPIHIDFSSDPTVNNNPNFVVRWTFLAPSNTGTSGNDRYDNISLSGNQLSVTCNGNNNYTATAGVKYGVTPYTYSWSPSGGSSNIASNLIAGTYTLTVKDGSGCSLISAITVGQPVLLTASIISSTNVSCNGYFTGGATASASGGTSPYNYSWSPSGGTLNSINGVSSATYTVTVTDAVGCATTTSVTLSQPATLVAAANTTANANCNVLGSASSSASGGTLPYTYSWSDIQTAPNATGLSAGNYTITIIDSNGCSATATATITQPATIGISIASVSNILCFGGMGTITAGTPSGGTSPYTYSWSSGGGSNQSATALAGTYTITVFDNNDCSATTSATITQPTQVQISIATVNNASCSGNGSVTANGATGGTLPYTYSWSGGGGSSLTASLSAGTYSITATDNNGCSATASATIAPAIQLRDSVSLAGQYEVIHYWDFNNTPPAGGGGGDSLGTSTFPLPAPYSVIPGGNARIIYSHPSGGGILDNGAPAAGQEAWNNDLPLLGNDTAGVALNNLYIRSRNPDINSYMYLYLPTSGFTNVKLDYAISVSSTKGANFNLLSYSANGGASWNNLTTAMDTFKRHSNSPDSLNMLTATPGEQAGTAWTPIHIDFSSDPTINNNPNFVVRWTFLAPSNTGTSGNDRYDNISLSGNLLTETCFGGNEVNATAQVKYGTAPYTYSWAPSGGTSITASNLAAGTYTLNIHDANGCSGSSSVTISNPPLLTATIPSSTSPTCSGGSNGTATASPSGGTAPYKYSWSAPGGTLATVSGLSAGTFTLTVTDAFGCTGTASTTITQPLALVASISTFTNATCSSNGSATAGVTNGTSPYTYSWSDVSHQTTVTATNLTAGTYTVLVTDNHGCSGSANVTITQSASSVSVSITSSTNVECTANGTASASPSGGTLPYTYSWSNGQTVSTATGLTAGSFTVTVHDNSGCSSSTIATISLLPLVRDSISLAGQYEVIHYWDFNNTLPAGGGGGDSLGTSTFPLPAPYSVIPGGNARIIYSHPSGGGILDNGAPAAGQEAWNNDLPLLGNDTAGVALNNLYIRSRNPDINSYMYLYLPTSGFTNVKLDYAISVSSTKGANFNLLSYSANGGASWNNLTTAMDTFKRHSNSPDSLNMLTATPGEQAGTAWTPIHIDFRSDPTINNNPNFVVRWTFLAPANTGTSGNDRYDNISLSGNLLTETCFGGNEVNATAQVKYGTAPYTYSWAPSGGTSITTSNLAAGTYTLNIHDANGCSGSSSVTISNPPLLTATIPSSTSPTCSGGSNGTATASPSGGTAPYKYSWSAPGGTLATVSGLSAGTFTLTVTDAFGCTGTASTTITQPLALVASISTFTNATCSSNGSATAGVTNGTSPYTYSWSDVSHQTTVTATNLTAGTYTVLVTDNHGCSGSANVTITQPSSSVSVSITSHTNVECLANGNASASPSGGTLPYTYSWSNGQTASAATSLGAGTYTVTVHDNSGCVSSASVSVAQIPQIRDSVSSVSGQLEVIHYWDFNNTLPSSGGGGDSLGTSTFPLTAPYSLIPGSNPRIVYSRPYAIQTAAGATRRDSIVDNYSPTTPPTPPFCYINDLPLLGNDSAGVATGNLTIRSRNPDVNSYMYLYLPTTGYSNVVLNYAISASSTKGALYNIFSYSTNGGTSWKNLTTAMDTFNIGGVYRPDTLQFINPTTSVSAWYPVQINFSSDPSINNNPNFILRWEFEGGGANGTSGNDRYDNISLSGSLSTETCYGGNQVTAYAGVKYGTAPYTYSWAPSGGSSTSASGLTAGTYILTVTDGIGCSASSTVTVSNPPLLTATIASPANATCSGGTNGSASANVTGGTSPYKYSWLPSGGTLATASGLSAGTYTLTVSDAFGCTETNSVTITQPLAIIAAISSYTNATCSTAGSAAAGVTNGSSPYTYSWSDATHQTSVTATSLTAGTYTVTITDNHGCTGSANVTITQPPTSVSVSISSHTNVECTANGTASSVVSGGSSPYTYSWTDGETTATASALSAGTYTVTVTDNTGCNSFNTVTILQVSPLRDSLSALGQYKVIHYWDFNNTPPSAGGGGDSLGTSTNPLLAPYTLIPGGNPRITYNRPLGIQPGASVRDSIMDNLSPGAAINDLPLLGDDSSGTASGNLGIRSRNPDENQYITLYLPTTGYSNIVLNYAISASSTKGAFYNIFTYSTNGGATWNKLTRAMDTFNTGGVYHPDTLQMINPTTAASAWYPVQINFSSDPLVNNNPNFILRWQFEGSGSTGTSGNDRYDNISLSGYIPTETCYGGSDVTATAGIKYGTAPYTYSWSPNVSSSSTASNLSAGTYSLTVRDANGCSASSSVTVSQPVLLSLSLDSIVNISCNQFYIGAATAHASGGTSPYNYSWSPGGGSDNSINGVSAGTYTITVNDILGCSASAAVTLTQPLPLVANASVLTNVNCTGNSTGTALAVASGDASPYTYLWSDANSQSTATATELSAGTYTVTVQDSCGAFSATASVIITQAASSVGISIASVSNVSCFGSSGSAIANPATGGTSPYTYSWSGAAGINLSISVSAGTYTITVTDSNGCTATAAAAITQPASAVTISIASVSNVYCNGGTGNITANNATGGTSPYTYSWSDGAGTNLTISNITAGSYTITATDNNGCSATTSATVTQPVSAITISISSITNVSCSSGGNGNIKANSPSGGTSPYTYSWSGGGGSSFVATGLGAGTYTLLVTDSNGCTATTSATITQPSNAPGITIASVSNVNCFGENGSVLANIATGGTSPYTYSWSGGAGIDLNISVTAGSYTITVTDSNGCTATAAATITQPVSALGITIASVSNIFCSGGSGSITANTATGGTSPYTYSWTDGGGTYLTTSNITAGTYTITVTDYNGCSATAFATITQSASTLNITISSVNNITCSSGNGSITANAATGGSSPYTYSWSSGGGTNLTTVSLSAGTYTLTVSDAHECSAIVSATITQPASSVEIGTIDVVNVLCTGRTGTITIETVTGGTSPYTYSWSGGAGTNSSVTVLAGTYTVTVTDNNGCQATASATVTQPATSVGISISSVNNVFCYGGTGNITANAATGGTPPYTYTWHPGGGNTLTTTAISAGTYTIVVIDNNGCTATAATSVTQPASSLAISISSVSNALCNSVNGNITANAATGGTSPYTYSWSPSGGTSLSASVTAGTYTITVTDNHGCMATASASITQGSALSISISSISNVNCRGELGSVTASAAIGGTSPYTYSWSGGAGTSLTIFVTAGTYTITAEDANGCTASASTTVTQVPFLGISIASVNNIMCYGNTGSLTANTATGGVSPYTYTWNPYGGTGLTATGLSAGTFTVIVVDNNGCSSTATAAVTQPATAIGISIASVSNASCNGATGSATANAATGGVSPYTYSWSGGGGTNLGAALSAGSYTITATDNNGCTATAQAVITQPTATVSISIASVNNISCGTGLGSATANGASGGTSPYTYSWSDGSSQSTLTATGLSAGTYTITVTDNNGCGATAGATITEPANSLGISLLSVSNVLCNGGTGSATVNAATGGTVPYTYSWSDGGSQSSVTATGLSAGTYTLTVTDNNGCSAITGATITEPATAVSISIASVSNVLCNGGQGSAGANGAGGGVSPYTYSWSDGSSQATLTATGLSAGTYTITVTDSNGCTATAAGVITEPANALGVTIASVENVSIYGQSTGSATANGATGGTSPYTYSWSDGASQSTLTATGLSAGTYTLTVTDNNGCGATAAATITEPANALGITIATESNVSCNGGNGSIVANAATGGTPPYTYSWSPNGGTDVTATVSAGTYTITVTDNAGAVATATATITEPATAVSISISGESNVSCNGGQGSASANAAGGGVSPYTYSWSDGSSQATLTATGLSAGTYTITVTDSNGCTATAAAVITQPANGLGISIGTVNNVLCTGGTGSAGADGATGGTSPYTYSWSDGNSQSTVTATGLSAGTYTLTVMDSNGCSASAAAVITQPLAALSTGITSVSNVLCNGGTGSITANTNNGGTPPYTFSWSPVGGSALTAAVSAGTYTITVTDNNGCTGTAMATVTEPATGLSVSTAVSSSVSCNGQSNGSGNASVSGGTSPYSYSWSNGATVSSLSGLSAGTYTVTVTDNNGCSATHSMNIIQPAAMGLAMVIQANVSCNGGGNGVAKVGVSGGHSPYTYSWSSGSTTYLASNLSAGTYTVLVTDKNGCNASATATMTQPAAFGSSVSITNPNCAVSMGSAVIGVSGGTSPYTYTWSPAVSSSSSATGLSVRSYRVTVRDAHGCSSTVTFAISQPSALRDSVVRASVTEVLCGLSNSGSATVGVKYGTQPYTYSWSNGSTTATASGLSAGTYSVTVEDANTCSVTASVTITQTLGAVSIVTVIQANVSCNGGSNGVVKAGVSGGASPYTYSWTPGGSTAYLASNLSAGTYTVSITDKNGCTNSASIVLTQATAIRDSLVNVINPGCYGGSGSAGIGIAGGTLPYTYSWSNGSTASTATGLTARSYTVTIRDGHGCRESITFAITQPYAVRDSIVRASTVNELCNGSSTGSATVGAKYGTQPYTYSWSNGSTTSTAGSLSAGTYSVTVMDGCGNTATATVSITQPTAIRDSLSSNTCTGGLITASIGVRGGIAPYTYSWSPGGGTKATMTGLSAGTYTITVTDRNHCSVPLVEGLSCGAVIASPEHPDGAGNNCCPGALYNVDLYPNPNSGQFTIAGVEKGMTIEVFDYTGRKVSVISAGDVTVHLDIANEPNGVYLVRILDKDGNLVSEKKVVKVQ